MAKATTSIGPPRLGSVRWSFQFNHGCRWEVCGVWREGSSCLDPVDLPACRGEAWQSKTSDNRRGSQRTGCVYRVRCNGRYHQKKWYLAMVSQAGDAIGNEEKYAFGLIRDRASHKLWCDSFFEQMRRHPPADWAARENRIPIERAAPEVRG